MSDCQSMPRRLSDGRYSVKRLAGISYRYSADMATKSRSEYGARLYAARKHAGLTQTALAKAAGMSQSAYAEAETTGLKSTYTAQLAAACGVRPQWLAVGEGRMLDSDTTEDDLPEVEQLASAIELITKALMNTDEFHRGLVRHSLSQLGLDSGESGNISHKIADLLVTKPTESAPRHDPLSTTAKVGVLIGSSATKDLGGQDGRGNRDAEKRSAKR